MTSPDGLVGVELALEPMGFEPSRTYQKALFEAGIPVTAFISSDIQADYARLKDLGVHFRGEPAGMGPIIAVSFEDACGNLIQIVEPVE